MPKESKLELPANPQAERAILGCILMDNAYFSQCSMLVATDFSLSSHVRIYHRMTEMIEAEEAIDLVTLAEKLNHFDEAIEVGGIAYVCDLTQGLPRHMAIRDYVRIVKGKSLARRLIAACTEAVEAAYGGSPGLGIIQLLRENLDEIEREAKTK